METTTPAAAPKLVQVTAEKWSDVLSDYRVYHTESQFSGGYAVMYSRLSGGSALGPHGTCIGEVHYLANSTREYFLLSSLV